MKMNPKATVFLVGLAGGLLTAGTWLGIRLLKPSPRLADVRRAADLGKWEQAEEAVTRYLSQQPRDDVALMLAARIAAGRGRVKQCAELLDRVSEDSDLKQEALMHQAQAYQELNSAKDAERSWREVIRISGRNRAPNSAYRTAAQAELVRLLSMERRPTEAREILWQMYPGHKEPWRILVTLSRVGGKPSDAAIVLPVLERLFEQDPSDSQICRALANYLMELSRWLDVVEKLAPCLEQNPPDSRSLEILLECNLRLQHWDAVDEILSRPELSSTSPRVLLLRGQRLAAADRPQEAEACLREAVRMNPLDPPSHFHLAQVLFRHNQRENGEEHMAQFQQLKSHQDAITNFLAKYITNDSQTWEAPEPATCVELSEHCQALGRTDEARAWLDEALRQQPGFPSARDALERLQAG